MRLITQIAALLVIVVGAILFPMPVPIGIFFLAIGFAMLIASSTMVRKAIRKCRGRHEGLNRFLNKAEQFAPKFVGSILRKTNPSQANHSG